MSQSSNSIKKTTALRNLLTSPQTEFILEAHNGISAKIVEEAGFKGIWGSGLAMSAQFGVRDNNEASWTQVVDMLEFMSDATNIPILLDGDTGYGDFNNMRRLVKKLEQRNIGGVCIEDKLFPKTNSFIGGERQPLADVEEFCGKIKAGKDIQLDDDFSIVARVEALIAGWGMEEALRRAEAYRLAGADAILMHSKISRPDEILTFAKEWAGRSPLVIVPTKYYSTPTDVFRQAGISLVIWANHLIRSAVASMQETARVIYQSESLIDCEDQIATVSELFRLQGADELLQAEKRYMTAANNSNAIILGASRGEQLDALTEEMPKVMLPIAGKPLLRHLLDEFKKEGVNDITVVAGYKAEAIDVQGIKIVTNPDYADSGELTSLVCALDEITDDTLILYGDLLFRRYVLDDLLNADGEIIVVIDSAPINEQNGNINDLAYCARSDDRALFSRDIQLEQVSREHDWHGRQPDGRWIGMLRVTGAGGDKLRSVLNKLREHSNFAKMALPDLLNCMIAEGHAVTVLYINGHWLDVNNLDDLRRAGDFAYGH
jgi:phosphoenolpyruvate phosphomutase